MKQYKDRNKKEVLQDIMQNRKEVSFKVLEQLEADGMLDDYDLFRIISDHYRDMYMFYYKRSIFCN